VPGRVVVGAGGVWLLMLEAVAAKKLLNKPRMETPSKAEGAGMALSSQ
jgi:hypothetical protein